MQKQSLFPFLELILSKDKVKSNITSTWDMSADPGNPGNSKLRVKEKLRCLPTNQQQLKLINFNWLL